jgi:non-heme chloroperoxidase
MSTFKTRDDIEIFYKDWSAGQAVVFSHGWPLCADAWDVQMMFLGERGHRVVAHDRRGHGRSEQSFCGNDMDTYADDLAELLDRLDLRDVVLVGHSTGGGEVVRYITRHGTGRVARLVLVSAVPPLMLKTDRNPGGLPMKVFDEIRAGTLQNRSQFFRDLAVPFYGYNRKGAPISQGVIDEFWRQGMLAGIKPAFDCIKAFSETDFTEELQKLDLPTLIVHGDDDQIVPFGAAGSLSAKLVRGSTLKIYRGGPHGLPTTHQDALNGDLLRFIEGGAGRPSVPPPIVH